MFFTPLSPNLVIWTSHSKYQPGRVNLGHASSKTREATANQNYTSKGFTPLAYEPSQGLPGPIIPLWPRF